MVRVEIDVHPKHSFNRTFLVLKHLEEMRRRATEELF